MGEQYKNYPSSEPQQVRSHGKISGETEASSQEQSSGSEAPTTMSETPISRAEAEKTLDTLQSQLFRTLVNQPADVQKALLDQLQLIHHTLRTRLTPEKVPPPGINVNVEAIGRLLDQAQSFDDLTDSLELVSPQTFEFIFGKPFQEILAACRAARGLPHSSALWKKIPLALGLREKVERLPNRVLH